MGNVNGYDIAFAAITGLFMFLGAWRGLIAEAIKFIAVLAGFSAAIMWYGQLYPHLGFLPVSARTTTALSFILVFVAVAAAVLAAGWVFRKIIHLTVLGWVDRLFGALIGALKALVLIWVFILSVNSSPLKSVRKSMRSSRVYTILTSLPPSLKVPSFAIRPGTIENMIEQPVRKLHETRERIEELRHRVDSAKTGLTGR